MTGAQTCALRSEEHTSELQSHDNLVCRLLLAKNKQSGFRDGPGAHRVHYRVHPASRAGRAESVGSAPVRRGSGVGGVEERTTLFFFKEKPAQQVYPSPLPGPSAL